MKLNMTIIMPNLRTEAIYDLKKKTKRIVIKLIFTAP